MVIERWPGSPASMRRRSEPNGSGAWAAIASESTERIWSSTCEQIFRGEGRLAGAEFVEEYSQREDVAGLGRGLAANLLGRQVSRSAEETVAGLGEPELGRFVSADRPSSPQAAGQAEVEDLDEALGCDHHVLGLQVAVHDPLGMGRRHARRDLAGDR